MEQSTRLTNTDQLNTLETIDLDATPDANLEDRVVTIATLGQICSHGCRDENGGCQEPIGCPRRFSDLEAPQLLEAYDQPLVLS